MYENKNCLLKMKESLLIKHDKPQQDELFEWVFLFCGVGA